MKFKLVSFLELPISLQMETRNWRNSKNVAPFFKIKYIPENVHIKWLESLRQIEPEAIAFAIKCDENYVGVTYFHHINRRKKVADWGIYIYDKNYHGQGIGKKSLLNCIDYARRKLNLERLYLDVLKDNLNAKKLYENCGFKIVDIVDDYYLRYVLIL